MKKKAFLLALAAFIFGAVCGGWGVAHFYERFTNTWAVSSLAANAGVRVSTLERLHSGKETNAVELLEITLDGDLAGLGVFLADVPESRCDPTQIKILRMARDYRAKFPRKTSLIDEGVTQAFALLEGQPRGFLRNKLCEFGGPSGI